MPELFLLQKSAGREADWREQKLQDEKAPRIREVPSALSATLHV